MLYKQSDINTENLVKLAVTINTSKLENAVDEVIWREYQQIKPRSSTKAGKYGAVGPMGYTRLEKLDDDDSCCAIM